jgi:putative ABC transport system permease protein
MIVAAGGSLTGALLGLWGARGIAASYVSMLGIPFLKSGLHPGVIAIAVSLAFASCAAAAVIPAWKSSRLAPAIAMHADPNQSLSGGGIPLVERLLSPVLPKSFTFRVPLRNVFRSRRRSVYTVLGIAFAMVLSVSTVAMFDSIDYLIGKAFTSIERWDVMAAFSTPVNESRIAQVRRIEGVERVQRGIMLPVKLSFGGREEDALVTAASPKQDFHGFEPGGGASPAQAMEAGDLVLASSLAKSLGVAAGARVKVDSPLLDDPVYLRVGALSDELAGQPVFVSLETAARLTGAPITSYNALYLDVDPALANRIQDEIYDMPGAANVQVKADLSARLESLMQLMNLFGAVLFAFGAALAFVVVFTTFTANVTERTREIATMRTIGEDNAHLAWMITAENMILAVGGLPLGIWLGVKATNALFASFSTDSYSLKAVIFTSSVAQICGLMLLVMLLSEIPPVRRIFRLDLAEATKVME